MTNLFEPYVSDMSNDAVIKVIGVGGGGGNAIAHMIRESVAGVQFIAVNTDAQALSHNNADIIIQIGNAMTKGLGAGANPQVGRDAALEDQERIKTELQGADMVFIAAGMGGGTGTGAAPIIAEIAKELGILTVAVVTKPFDFEGKKRMAFAEQGITELSKYVDSVITIPNEKLLKVLGRGVTLLEAFAKVNDVLKNAVQGIAELITGTSAFGVNVDFADAKTVMQEMGQAMMGSGVASGEDRAEKAIDMAISSPLLEDIDLSGARGVLVNVTAGFDLRLDEFDHIGSTVRAFASEHATIVAGAMIDPDIQDEIRVTVVATGIGNEKKADLTLVSSPKDRMGNRVAPQNLHVHKEPIRQSASSEISESHASDSSSAVPKQEMEYFDIPAFIRNQAD